MKIFCHFIKPGEDGSRSENIEIEFDAFPAEGEYIARSPTSPWYRVTVIVHTPFEDKKLAGEIYAVEVNWLEALERDWQGTR